MAHGLYRISTDVDDGYVVWSTVVDAPVSGRLHRSGVRRMYQQAPASMTDAEVAELIAYADAVGSAWGYDSEVGSFEDRVLYTQFGELDRSDLGEFVDALANGTSFDHLTHA